MSIRVPTSSLYFSQFGGYSGLDLALSTDVVEIPEVSSGELAQPGSYSDVTISEIQSHGRGRYSYLLSYQLSHLHTEHVSGPHHIFRGTSPGDVLSLVVLQAANPDARVGYYMGIYFLEMSSGELLEFKSASSLQEYVKTNWIRVDTLRVVHVTQQPQSR